MVSSNLPALSDSNTTSPGGNTLSTLRPSPSIRKSSTKPRIRGKNQSKVPARRSLSNRKNKSSGRGNPSDLEINYPAGIMHNPPFSIRIRITNRYLMDLYKQLARAFDRNAPIDVVLDILRKSASSYGKNVKGMRVLMLSSWILRMRSGLSLSQSMQGWVPDSHLLLIRSGESRGSQARSFRLCISSAENSAKMKASIRKALMYPCLMATAALGLIYMVAYQFLPTFSNISPPEEWTGAGETLYTMTEFVTSGQVYLYIAGLILLILFIKWLLPRWSGVLRDKLSSVPILFEYQYFHGINFLYSVSNLVKSGEDFVSALSILMKTASSKGKGGIIMDEDDLNIKNLGSKRNKSKLLTGRNNTRLRNKQNLVRGNIKPSLIQTIITILSLGLINPNKSARRQAKLNKLNNKSSRLPTSAEIKEESAASGWYFYKLSNILDQLNAGDGFGDALYNSDPKFPSVEIVQNILSYSQLGPVTEVLDAECPIWIEDLIKRMEAVSTYGRLLGLAAVGSIFLIIILGIQAATKSIGA